MILIISCGSKKRKVKVCRAIDLYDGPRFKILRKYNNPSLKIYILSAQYGLIKSTDIIRYYDLKMTKERAIELSPILKKQFQSLDLSDDIICCMSDLYLDSLKNISDHNFLHIRGTPGITLKKLKSFLMKGVI